MDDYKEIATDIIVIFVVNVAGRFAYETYKNFHNNRREENQMEPELFAAPMPVK